MPTIGRALRAPQPSLRRPPNGPCATATKRRRYSLAEWDGGGLRHVTNRQVDCGFASLAFDKVKPPRQAFAPGVEFMLDLSGGLATDETIRLCQRFEELDITWIEEPADLFDVGTLKKTSKRVAITMAVSDGRALKLNEPDVEQHTNGLERPLWVNSRPNGGCSADLGCSLSGQSSPCRIHMSSRLVVPSPDAHSRHTGADHKADPEPVDDADGSWAADNPARPRRHERVPERTAAAALPPSSVLSPARRKQT
jgi:hypothetical protein